MLLLILTITDTHLVYIILRNKMLSDSLKCPFWSL